MTLPRKGNYTLRTLRARDDHDLFRITLPRYDPKLLSDILLLVRPGQTLRPQQPIVLLTYATSQGLKSNQEDPSLPEQVELGSHVAGVIEAVGSSFGEDEGGWRLREEVKGWQLQLCQVRACQHIIQKQSISDSLIRKEGAPICPNCLKPIWIHLHPDILTLTSQDLLNHNPDLTFSDLSQLQWTIVLNEQFTPTTSIAKVSDKDVHYPLLAKAVYLIGEGEKPTLNTPIMKIQKLLCRHEKVVEHRCQYCLQVLQAQELGQFNRYLFQLGKVGSRGLARGSALAQQQQEYILGLVAKNKAILILDLDNTILHSCQMNQLTLGSLLGLKQYFVMPKIQQVQGKVKQDFIVVKIRPFFQEFLFTINQLFELYVYTKGTRIYAEQICRWVRHQWAGDPSPYDLPTWPAPSPHFLKNSECFSPHRLISRNEDASLDTKSMQNILPSRTQYHLILDDRRDVWANSPSWFYTRDYFYFIKRGKQGQDVSDFLQPPSTPLGAKLTEYYTRMRQDYLPRQDYQLQLAERQDFFLLYTCHALKKIHHHFFRHLQKYQETEKKEDKETQKHAHPVSIAGVMQKAKLFLAKKKLRFFLAPGDEGISTTRRSLKMGAIVLKPNSTDIPDFIIRGNSFIKYVNQYSQNKESMMNESLLQKQLSKEKMQNELLKQTPMEEKNANQEVKSQIQNIPQEVKQNQSEEKNETKKDIDYQMELEVLTSYKDKGLPIIAETWILASYEFSYKFKWQDFVLQDPLKEEVDHHEFNQILKKEAFKIRSQIRQQMDQG